MRRVSLFPLLTFLVGVGQAQSVVERYEKTIDLRPLLANSESTRLHALYTRNRQPILISTISTAAHADAYSQTAAADGTLSAPFKLNQNGNHGAYLQSILDSRGNLYYYGAYGYLWKFSSPTGPWVGSTNVPGTGRIAANELGNAFSSSSIAGSAPNYTTNSWLFRYASNLAQNFQFFENTNEMFNSIAVDRSNNFWAVGLTYTGNPQGSWSEAGVIVRKYDSHMSLVFAKSFPGRTYGIANLAAADSTGNLYVLSRSVNLPGGMLRKFSPQGAILWERTIDGAVGLFSESNLIVSEDGRISFLANYPTGVDLFQYSSSGGLVRRTNVETEAGSSHNYRVLRADIFGQLYALVDVTAPSLQRRAVVAKFDASGAFLFSFDFPSTLSIDPSIMNVEPEIGDIYVGRTYADAGVRYGILSAFSQQPVAKADTLTVPTSTQVSLPVFANDRYMGSYPYQFKITKAPLHGKIITGGTMYYKSDADYTGPDEFYYRAVRNGLESFQVKVSLTVQ